MTCALGINKARYMIFSDPVERRLAGKLEVLFNVLTLYRRQSAFMLAPAPMKELLDLSAIRIEGVAAAAIAIQKFAGVLEIALSTFRQWVVPDRQLRRFAPRIRHLLKGIKQRSGGGLSFSHIGFLVSLLIRCSALFYTLQHSVLYVTA